MFIPMQKCILKIIVDDFFFLIVRLIKTFENKNKRT